MRTTIIMLAASTALILSPVQAQQRSMELHLEIGKAFDEIDERSREYEEASRQMLHRLDELEQQMAGQEARCSRQVKELSGEAQENKKHECHARQTETLARWYSIAASLYDRAGQVISENTKSIHALYERIKEDAASSETAERLEAKIQNNIKAGRAMRVAAQDLLRLSQSAPQLGRHVQSLNSIMATLDRGITLDKQRQEARRDNKAGATQNVHLQQIEASLDTLLDLYNNLSVEKRALAQLREELKLAVYGGTLKAAVTASKRAIPTMNGKVKDTMVPGLTQVSRRVWKLNDELLEQAPSVSGASTTQVNLNTFKNF